MVPARNLVDLAPVDARDEGLVIHPNGEIFARAANGSFGSNVFSYPFFHGNQQDGFTLFYEPSSVGNSNDDLMID